MSISTVQISEPTEVFNDLIDDSHTTGATALFDRITHSINKVVSRTDRYNAIPSVGNRIGGLPKGYICWEVRGPAKSRWDKLFSELQSHFKNSCNTLPGDLMCVCYMAGKSREKARPTIFFCSKNPVSRKRAQNSVKESGLLDEYEEFRTGQCDRDPSVEIILQFAGAIAQEELFKIKADAIFLLRNEKSGRFRIMDAWGEPLARGGTIAGAIQIDGKPFFLTTAHTFTGKSIFDSWHRDYASRLSFSKDSGTSDDTDISDFSIDEGEDDGDDSDDRPAIETCFGHDSQLTSGDKAEEESAENLPISYLPLGENEDANAIHEMGLALESEGAICEGLNMDSTISDKAVIDSGCPHDTRYGEEGRPISVALSNATMLERSDVIKWPSDRLEVLIGSGNFSKLDFALIEIPTGFPYGDKIIPFREPQTPRRFDRPRSPNLRVVIRSFRTLSLFGTVSNSSSFVFVPETQETQDIWTIRLDRSKPRPGDFLEESKEEPFAGRLPGIGVGDSGSWVLDAQTGELVGQVVAGDPLTGALYAIPAGDIFKAIESLHGNDIVVPPQTNPNELPVLEESQLGWSEFDDPLNISPCKRPKCRRPKNNQSGDSVPHFPPLFHTWESKKIPNFDSVAYLSDVIY